MPPPLPVERVLRLRLPWLASPVFWRASPARQQPLLLYAPPLSLARLACRPRPVRSAVSHRCCHRHPHPRYRWKEFRTLCCCRDLWRARSSKCDRESPLLTSRNALSSLRGACRTRETEWSCTPKNSRTTAGSDTARSTEER